MYRWFDALCHVVALSHHEASPFRVLHQGELDDTVHTVASRPSSSCFRGEPFRCSRPKKNPSVAHFRATLYPCEASYDHFELNLDRSAMEAIQAKFFQQGYRPSLASLEVT